MTDPNQLLHVHDEEELCVCFHVKRRQIAKFLRLEEPRHASQCSECYGAGTGCGWCIPFIEKMFEQHQAGVEHPDIGLDPEEYRARRKDYLRRTPGAKPPPGSEDAAPAPPASGEDSGPLIDEILPE
jgi:bacterioferritin-associated ferredoxin